MLIRFENIEIELTAAEFKDILNIEGCKTKKIRGKEAVKVFKEKIQKNKIRGGGRPRKMTNETIETIKKMAEDQLKEYGSVNSQKIADQLGIQRQEVDYWRKNTPKNMRLASERDKV
jgi:hypothetical protein